MTNFAAKRHYNSWWFHYKDVIMGVKVSQITSLAIVYLSVYSDADQGKHQRSAPLAFVRGVHRWPVNSPHKGPVTRIFFSIVVVVTLFPTKYMKTHICITHLQLSVPKMFTCTVSVAVRKKPRLIELAAATCYLQFCRVTAFPGPEEMTHWHPGCRFKESFSSNGFHTIYSIILLWIISGYVPFHQMSF